MSTIPLYQFSLDDLKALAAAVQEEIQTREIETDARDGRGTPIEQIYPLLSTRAINALRADNYSTIEQLTTRTVHELLRIPNFGRRSALETIEALKSLGLRLKASHLSRHWSEVPWT